MGIHIAHPETKGRRRRKPVIHVATSEPTPLEILVAEANAKAKRKRAPRKTLEAAPRTLKPKLDHDGWPLELDLTISEDVFVGAIVEYAVAHGWLFDCKRQDESASHVPKGVAKDDRDEGGDGMPDLPLLHEERAMLVVLEAKKAKKGTALREKQVKWLSGLIAVASQSPNVVVKAVEPKDWPWIMAILSGRANR